MIRTHPAAAAAVGLLLVAGCTSGPSGQPQATCRPDGPSSCHGSGQPSARPESSLRAISGRGQLLGVITQDGRLELFEIGPDRPVARLVRELPGPRGMQAGDVALAAGTAPRVCATWSDRTRSVLRCYDAARDGHDVATGGVDVTGPIGLSTSGTRIAWVQGEQGTRAPTLFVLRIGDPHVLRVPAYADAADADPAALGAGDVAWSGEDTVLVSHSWDDDVNGSVAQVSVTKPPRGWTDAPDVKAAGGQWPVVLGASSSTSDGHVLALLEGFRGDNGREVFEAADLDLRANRVAEVIATPATQRWLIHVSGGHLGVVYRTQGEDVTDIRDYWRAPGRLHGERIQGLPPHLAAVVAQP